MFVHLAEVAVRIVQQPKSAPQWTDIAGFWAPLAGVVVTFLAVLVALFGPDWRRKQRSPRVMLEAESPWHGINIPSGSVYEFGLFIKNSTGRDTAHDVEVFVSAYARQEDGGHFPVNRGHFPVNRGQLTYGHIQGSNERPLSAAIPAGFSRHVLLAAMGAPDAVQGKLAGVRDPVPRESWAALAVDDRGTHSCWLDTRYEYRIELVIIGSNFDALTYHGTLAFEDPDEKNPYSRVRWTALPSLAAGPSDDWALEAFPR